MLVQRIERRYPCGRLYRRTLVNPRPAPADFDEVFVTIGRLAAQEHYRVGRLAINTWLEERGKQRLIDARAAFVRQHRRNDGQLRDMALILSRAFPVDG